MADRILALVTDAFAGKGGIARYNRDLLSAWARSAAVHVVPRGGGPTADLPRNLEQLGPVQSRILYALKAMAAAVRHRPTVVFCGHLFMAPLALVVARLVRARLVLQVHGIDAWTNPGGLRRWVIERADMILSVSRYTRSRLLSWASIDPERVVVLPNTVDERFVPGDRSTARAKFGFGSGPVILTVGRLDARERYKGHERVIDALPALLRSHPTLVYAIAGEGDDLDRLTERVGQTGLQGVVRFVGPVRDEDLPDLYRAADVFALPSTGEGFGIVFLEAMACGTPAVGLAVAGALDALQDGRLGDACAVDELPTVLDRLLHSLPVSESNHFGRGETLSDRVRQAFGTKAFGNRAEKILGLTAS